MTNKELIKEYPFLKPITYSEYDYSYTYLDDMPIGWRKTFGELLCSMLKEILIEEGLLDTYKVEQVKEKYGSLRWYSNIYNDKVDNLLLDFEHLSMFTCVECGKIKVRTLTSGWICPMCYDCWKKYNTNKISPKISSIDQYTEIATKGSEVFSPTYSYSTFKDNKLVEVKRDITYILDRLNI